jgi:hypothetical protein
VSLLARFAHLCLAENPNIEFSRLFETGVDEMSWDDMDDLQGEDFPWPCVADAHQFRLLAKAVIENLILTMPAPRDQPVTQESPYWALFMGFEHERIHLVRCSRHHHHRPLPTSVAHPPYPTGDVVRALPPAAI